MMPFPEFLRYASFALLLVLAAFDGVCLFARRRERSAGRRPPGTIENMPWFAYVGLFGGVFFLVLAAFMLSSGSYIFIFLFSFLALFWAANLLNWRIVAEDKGFAYRTSFLRVLHYAYADVQQVKHIGNDLYVRVRGRAFLIDETADWRAFYARYDRWRTQNGLPGLDTLRQRQLDARTARHQNKPFLEKLDRVRGGRGFMALYLIFGAFAVALGVFVLINTLSQPADTDISLVYDTIICQELERKSTNHRATCYITADDGREFSIEKGVTKEEFALLEPGDSLTIAVAVHQQDQLTRPLWYLEKNGSVLLSEAAARKNAQTEKIIDVLISCFVIGLGLYFGVGFLHAVNQIDEQPRLLAKFIRRSYFQSKKSVWKRAKSPSRTKK